MKKIDMSGFGLVNQ